MSIGYSRGSVRRLVHLDGLSASGTEMGPHCLYGVTHECHAAEYREREVPHFMDCPKLRFLHELPFDGISAY